MANHSGSVNKSAFAGDNDRWTDAEIDYYGTYFGKGRGDTDLVAYVYRVTMYDNKNEESVTSYESASFRGLTENTSASDIRSGIVYDGYYNADDGGVSSLISWYESHYGVTMYNID